MLTAVSALAGDILFTTPTPRDLDSNSWWNTRRAMKQKEIKEKGDVRVLFYGDSITEQWEIEGCGKKVWDAHFAEGPYKAIEFGYGGDSTHHLLYRLEHGEMDNLDPDVVILQIGTNNSWNQPEYPAMDSVLGVKAVLDKLRSKFYISRIVLCAIPPCGRDKNDPRRVKNDAINAEMIKMADHHTVFWLDWAKDFVNEEGVLDKNFFPDYVHPSEAGFQAWYEKLKPILDEFRYTKGTPETAAAQTKSEQGWWMQRMRERRTQILQKEDRKFDLVMLGDSITHMWEWDSNGKTVADEFFSKYSILNCGYGGDWTQNLLWRVRYGELDNYEAKLITVLIGTNNHKATKEEVASAIKLILDEIRARQPKAKILLHAIFPCNEKPDDPIRIKNDETNELIKKFADGENIIWFDINKKLMNEDGTISKDMFPDYLHPSPKGYRVWAEELKPYVEKYCEE